MFDVTGVRGICTVYKRKKERGKELFGYTYVYRGTLETGLIEESNASAT